MLFSLGKTVITPSAQRVLMEHSVDPSSLLYRHHTGDWGTISPEDKKMNDDGVKRGDKLLSSYQVGDGVDVWVITEWDRSVTTILLPEDY